MAEFKEKVTVDVHCACNRNVLFFPLHRALYSERRQTEVKSRSVPGWLGLIGGIIPGHRLIVDFKSMTAKLIDKTFLPENKALLAQIRELQGYDDAPDGSNRFKVGSESESPIEIRIAEEQVGDWLFHMRKEVDVGKFKLIDGKLPTIEEIKRLGFRYSYGEVWPGIKAEKGMPDPFRFEPQEAALATAGK